MDKILLAFILLFFSLVGYSQQPPVIIEGKVMNSESDEPLAFAHLALANNRLGTVTNVDGIFQIVIDQKYLNNYLIISHLGFLNDTIVIKSYENPVKIYLQESPHILPEVLVSDLTALDIIKLAIDKIPDNYFSSPYISHGFYRTKSQQDDEYIQLSEASFDIYQSHEDPGPQLKITRVRSIKDEEKLKDMTIGSRPANLISADLIYNRENMDFLNKKGLKNHSFKLDYVSNYNGRKVYVISFDQKVNVKKPLYKGTLYIDVEDQTFVHFDFQVSPRGIAYYKVAGFGQRRLMDILGIKVKLLDRKIKVTYEKVDGRYYFNQMIQSADFHIFRKKPALDYDSKVTTHYFVSEYNFDKPSPFREEEISKNNKMLEQQPTSLSMDYWQDQNVILPEFDFPKEARIIQERNKAIE